MKTSLEVEYWVVDDDGDLVPPDTLLDVSEQVDPEFVEPMLEIKTTPCESMAELREELPRRIGRVADAARERNKRLVPLATPLYAAPADVPYREKVGTDLQRRIVGPTFDDARFCAGTHVHFEQSNVADQLNALTAIDPAFALVTSAAHHRGERILECARPFLYRCSCYETCPEQGHLWPYVDSVAEWEQRLETAHGVFRERALERGVDPDAFDDEFAPYDAVWNPVRLRKAMPTVEWRSPDAALPSQVLRLAEAVRSIVSRADARGTVVDGSAIPTASDAIIDSNAVTDGPLRLPKFDTVESITDAAIHDGLGDSSVRRYLRGLGFEPSAYDPLADRHPDSRITERRAKKLRLRAADRLEADLERRRVRTP
ncbi:glutamate-cysteine ligase family protein [Natrinema salaciae]|uniref:Gamma-glutamyl:cysteine ligase YbdK, ATP-grasp superfamily n=1 Tax=Natrinema salaciae TaxID=1186196 RepID=A0A1H9JFV0_9EURY|nr:glutamate-cysteine ligase family protein [Natrinema salaciae]SEQ85637.1 Gamma-glutamyl:cysteine ligase YbdK, ATP-grasp superfamily [Natrinema salaciae]